MLPLINPPISSPAPRGPIITPNCWTKLHCWPWGSGELWRHLLGASGTHPGAQVSPHHAHMARVPPSGQLSSFALGHSIQGALPPQLDLSKVMLHGRFTRDLHRNGILTSLAKAILSLVRWPEEFPQPGPQTGWSRQWKAQSAGGTGRGQGMKWRLYLPGTLCC